MIFIEEILVANISDFWKIHEKYLVNDNIVTDDEDLEYFKSSEYRDIIKSHMIRDENKHHMIYFYTDDFDCNLSDNSNKSHLFLNSPSHKTSIINEISSGHSNNNFTPHKIRIGAAQFCTYTSEDGKCFILDFWVFDKFRGNGTGHKCFEALLNYTKESGAKYYEINAEGERRIKFWKSLGFVENGTDEWDMPLFILKFP